MHLAGLQDPGVGYAPIEVGQRHRDGADRVLNDRRSLGSAQFSALTVYDPLLRNLRRDMRYHALLVKMELAD